MKNPFKRSIDTKALSADATALDTIRSPGWSPFPLLGPGSRDRIHAVWTEAKSANYTWMYERSPAVSTVIDVIVRNIGQLDLRLFEELSEAERQPRPEHPAAMSLRYPNPETPRSKLIRQLFQDRLLADDAFALLLPAVGAQLHIEHLPYFRVEVQGDDMFRTDVYRIWRDDGTYVDVNPENVFHWFGENPRDNRIGLSKLNGLRDVIAEDAALQQAIVELANAGLSEAAWVFRPGDAPEWSNEARKAFEEDLQSRLRRRNSGPVVLEEGMELRSFGVSPQDAQVLEIRRFAMERVASAFGVPLGMIGLAENTNEARAQFYADTLPPYCKDFTDFLNHRILVGVYDWTEGCFEFNIDEKLMGDDRIKALVSASGRAVMLTNEARARLNLPPVDGGDELVTPLNVLVGDNPKPSPQIDPVQDPNGPARGRPAEGDTPGGTAPPPPKSSEIEAAVADILVRMYRRQERAARNGKSFTEERFVRDLVDDLAEASSGLNRQRAKTATAGIYQALTGALAAADSPREVFVEARKNADRLAKVLVAMLALDPIGMREMGVPDEFVWESAGYTPEQVDQMRALQIAHELTDASEPV